VKSGSVGKGRKTIFSQKSGAWEGKGGGREKERTGREEKKPRLVSQQCSFVQLRAKTGKRQMQFGSPLTERWDRRQPSWEISGRIWVIILIRGSADGRKARVSREGSRSEFRATMREHEIRKKSMGSDFFYEKVAKTVRPEL